MPRAMTMNQRAGTMFVTGCSQPGMLAIGKIIPDSSALGSIVPTMRAEHRRALRRRPRRDQARRARARRSSRACSRRAAAVTLPRNGTWKTTHAASERGDDVREGEAEVGQHLADDDLPGRSGETSSTSSVPRSFSRDSEIAVISAETSVSTSAISPGTNRFTLSSVGLNRMRVSARSARTGRARADSSASYAAMTRASVALHRRAGVRIRRVGRRAAAAPASPSREARRRSQARSTSATSASPRRNSGSTRRVVGATRHDA